MTLEEFDYDLPPERIAQVPATTREAARLLVLGRIDGSIAHATVAALGNFLAPGDLLVLNDTRVIPARLTGRKPSGGRVELLLLNALGGDERAAEWRTMLRASRAPRVGEAIHFGSGLLAIVLDRDGETWRVRLEAIGSGLREQLELHGRLPLPPYIVRESGEITATDAERYQTVFARHDGAIAAPTAGLHFTHELLAALLRGGIDHAHVTLHVGSATFLPVRSARVEDHVLEPERYCVTEAAVSKIDATRARGGRVVAVGTTVVRVLESCATPDGSVRSGSGETALFILPGHRFRAVDALLTNFHLPRSTLLMLVAAFTGRERLLAAYAQAVESGYRFYSYGDAMLVRPA
jgi:S-adenosylmethionine:tRNA ribosyltransferase-isomerase